MGKTMREVFGRTLQDMKEDPKLVVLDAIWLGNEGAFV